MTDNDNPLSVEKDFVADNQVISDDACINTESDIKSEPILIPDEIKDVLNSSEPEQISDDASLEDVIDAISEAEDASSEDADFLFVKSPKQDEDGLTFSLREDSAESVPVDDVSETVANEYAGSDYEDNLNEGQILDETEKSENSQTETLNEKRCLTAPNFIAPDLQKGISDIADCVVMFASGVNKKCCRVLVTSPARSTGKTTVALMLAMELSKDYKVLLVDCDFYKPRLHKYFNCMNRFGVLNAYLGEVELNKVLLNSDNENLKFITSGKGLKVKDIKGKAVASMLDSLSESFDFVIFDSASVFKARYVSGIAASVDGSVLVIKKGSTEYSDFDRCLDRLDIVGSEVLGVVLNS